MKSGETCDYPSMDMPQSWYMEYCAKQRKKKVLNMSKTISKIQNMTAQQLLKFGGQADSVPVDLMAILEAADISCLPYDFSNIEKQVYGDDIKQRILGALVTKDDNAAIFYRATDDVDGHRYRFTIAHELAHCCLSHIDFSQSRIHLALREEGEPKDEKEVAANIFAGEILIPREALENVIKKLILPSVQTLADIFAVSVNVMRARLDYLKIRDNIVGYNY